MRAPVERGMGRVAPEHLALAGVTVPIALEDLDGRRLTGAARTDEGEDLAGVDREVDAPHRLVRTVRCAQAPNADDGVVAGSGPRGGNHARHWWTGGISGCHPNAPYVRQSRTPEPGTARDDRWQFTRIVTQDA